MRTNRVFVCLVLTLLSLSVACSRGPASTAESFYRHLEEGELDAALDLVSSSIVSQVGRDKLRSGLISATESIADKGGIDDIEIAEESTTGQISQVRLILHYGNGTTDEETVQLIEEEGEWKLKPEK